MFMQLDKQSVISVVGPTASGKTNFALRLAKQLLSEEKSSGVDLISADSKQIYQGISILTGADIPSGFEARADRQFEWSYFSKNKINLHGIAIIPPLAAWSVAHFRNFGKKIITAAVKHNRKVIIVGGTGLYHRWLFADDSQLSVPPNAAWRQTAKKMDLYELQNKLQQLDSAHFQAMNRSDQQNPRRLIRAVEIKLFQIKSTSKVGVSFLLDDHQYQTTSLNQNRVSTHSKTFHVKKFDDAAHDQSVDKQGDVNKAASFNRLDRLTIGISIDLQTLQQKITNRVRERFKGGAVNEVAALLDEHAAHPNHPIFTTLGFSEISQYLHHKISAVDCQQLWALHEHQYAKRQLTWWKRENVCWVTKNEPLSFR